MVKGKVLRSTGWYREHGFYEGTVVGLHADFETYGEGEIITVTNLTTGHITGMYKWRVELFDSLNNYKAAVL